MKPVSILSAISMLLLFSSCSSAPKTVPLKVYSEPAGGYVIYRVDSNSDVDAPWVYLGTTPLESSLQIEKALAKDARKLSVRVMKEGYFDISKDWEPEKVKADIEERKMIFWNPSLVEHKTK